MPEVIVLLGSPADMSWAERIREALDAYGIRPQVRISSAHKTPRRLLEMLDEYERRDSPTVFITVAGRSNALSGFVDAAVASPVIACPPPSDSFGGMDILSSLRMPRGVAPMVVLDPENAALAVAKMLALADASLLDAVRRKQEGERERVAGADIELQSVPGTTRSGSP